MSGYSLLNIKKNHFLLPYNINLNKFLYDESVPKYICIMLIKYSIKT